MAKSVHVHVQLNQENYRTINSAAKTAGVSFSELLHSIVESHCLAMRQNLTSDGRTYTLPAKKDSNDAI